MSKFFPFARKLLGRSISFAGFTLMTLISIWFLLQLVGMAESGVIQFGVFGYALLLLLLLFPGFGLFIHEVRISGDK